MKESIGTRIDCTTREETWTAIRWAYSTFEGLDNYCLNGWRWIEVPGHYDNSNGTTTYFPLYHVSNAFSICRLINVLEYRAYYKDEDAYKKVLIELVFKAAEIRHKNINQTDKKFLNDYKFYTRIKSSIDDKEELKRIKDELTVIGKEIHWPHYYETFSALQCLLNVLLKVRRIPCPNDSARPDSVAYIIHKILDFYPVSDETWEEFKNHLYSLCDNNSYTEYDEEEEPEEENLDGYQAGNVDNRPFEFLLSSFKNAV